METDFHSIKVTHVPSGFQAACTCGWLGPVVEYPVGTSGRFAFSEARQTLEGHWAEVQKRRADSAQPESK